MVRLPPFDVNLTNLNLESTNGLTTSNLSHQIINVEYDFCKSLGMFPSTGVWILNLRVASLMLRWRILRNASVEVD